MLKKTLIASALPLLFLLGTYAIQSAAASQTGRIVGGNTPTGTFQKMIVENGSVTMDLDLDALNPQSFPGSLTARPVRLQFAVAVNSFFPILVFNDLLRAAEPGSMALIPAEVNASRAAGYSNLPGSLSASLKGSLSKNFRRARGSTLPSAIAAQDLRFLMLKEATTI